LSSGLDRFAEIVCNDQFDLAEASLLVAQDVYPSLDVHAYLVQLDEIAAAIRKRVASDAFAEQKLMALNYYLFNEMRFVGNVDNYYDPRNSYLNEVLERRTGIPLTLSIVYLEVGRRLGLNLKGVSFPGHFLVKLTVKRGQLVLDPFLGGEAQSEKDLRERLAQVLPPGDAGKADIDRYLEPATSRQVIARMLRNLKNIYTRGQQHQQALDVMQRMLLVVPEAAEELRDRGLLYEKLECFRPALSDLQNYLRRRPDAADAGDMYAKVVELKQACARLN
jgi:regulator of sirC expression with transglutaminase-like and TPR domain